MRIVSLLPSTTEILFAIGAGADVVGVTFECDFPPEARSSRVVSTSTLPQGLSPSEIDAVVRAKMAAGEDLYHLDEGALSELAPDLVVTQDLCAVCAVDVTTVDAAMRHLGCQGRVLTVDPGTLDEVLESIAAIGAATRNLACADELVGSLRARLDVVAAAVEGRDRPLVAMIEWTDPLFSAGHWVPDMVAAAGGVCALGTSGTRSEAVSSEALKRSGPEIIVVAPCGYNLEGATNLAGDLMRQDVLPIGVPIWAVDADAAFVRPGPRLVDGVETLAAICHPSAIPGRPDLAALVGLS